MRALIIFACLTTVCGSAYAQQPRGQDQTSAQQRAIRAPVSPARPDDCLPFDVRPECHGGTVPSHVGGNPIQGALSDLAKLLDSDFVGADALSTAIPDLQDGNGQQCWRTMKSAGEVFKAHPIPQTLQLATDIEAARLLFMTANKICGSAQCTQVFADGANVVQALGPIPIMSLNAICSKIPQIAIVPAATPVTPVPDPQHGN